MSPEDLAREYCRTQGLHYSWVLSISQLLKDYGASVWEEAADVQAHEIAAAGFYNTQDFFYAKAAALRGDGKEKK